MAALDIFYPDDVARVLAALDVASGGSASVVNETVERAARDRQPIDSQQLAQRLADYRRGYADALAGVALAFGITPKGWVALGEGAAILPLGAELPAPPWDG